MRASYVLRCWILGWSCSVAMRPGPEHHCCLGTTIRLGMPPASYKPWWSYYGPTTPTANDSHYTGFLPAVVNALCIDMGCHVEWVEVCAMDETYSACMAEAARNGSITTSFVQPEGYPGVVYTTILIQDSYRALVHRVVEEKGYWQVFRPFNLRLWLGILCAMITASIFIVVNHLSIADENEDKGSALLALSVYMSWSAFLGGEDIEWKGCSGRFFRIGFLFVILITNATYTANLAAFLTAPNVLLKGPADMDELKTAIACVSNEMEAAAVAPQVGSVIFPPTAEYWYKTPDQKTDWCREKLENDEADVLLSYGIGLDAYSLNHCGTLARVHAIDLLPYNFGLFFSAHNTDLADKFSRTISHLFSQPEYQRIKRTELKQGVTCSADDEDSDTEQVVLTDMGGLFFIYGGFTALALTAALCNRANRLRKQRNGTEKKEEDRIATIDFELLQQMMKQVEAIAAQQKAENEKQMRQSLPVADAKPDQPPDSAQYQPGQHAV